MKKKRMAALLMIIVMLVGIVGCGAKAESVGSAGKDVLYDGIYGSPNEFADDALIQENKSQADTGVINQKLVRKMTVEAETNDLDALLAELNARVASLEGYVEKRSVRNGSTTATLRYRHADLTIRIPVDQLDAFIEHIQGKTNVVFLTESADDITLRYVATQSRVTALETEQQRLLELLAKAENMTDLLLIEERLTNVRTELEEVTSQMRIFDNLVDYGTVQLTITEVQEYTAVEEQSLWQKIGSGLSENWQNLCDSAEAVFVFLITSLPYLIPIGCGAVITAIAVKLAMRKTKKKSPPTTEE